MFGDEECPVTAEPASYVMIVEDSHTQAMQLQIRLESQGWITTISQDGIAALEALDGRLPDLVLVDFHMPRMNGAEFVRRVRMNLRTRELRILMLTDSDSAEAETRGFECGADAYVAKSADLDILLARASALLRRQNSNVITQEISSGFRRSRLLVVDDSATYLQFISIQLENAGYEVIAVSSAADVLRLVEEESFDCIVIDLVMPEMSGTELCGRLDVIRRNREQLFQLIILTSCDSKDDMMRGFEAGADDFVSKSSDSEILKARIRSLLRRKILHEENTRITTQFKIKETELQNSREETHAAEARAALADALECSNRDLEIAYHELQETQTQLVHSAKMASLGELVAGIAHEINNPLSFVSSHLTTVTRAIATINSETTTLLSDSRRQAMEKIAQRLEVMRLGIDRVEDLVIKLRTFSRLDEAEIKTVDIEESIESVLTLLQHKMNQRIQIVRRYGTHKMLSCYPGPLNQVIMNIVSNGIDAIAGEGSITIETRATQAMFWIVIKDTGSGIPDSVRDRIFEPFFTTKPVGAGTGLGLSISYGIVRRHQGTLEIKSAHGDGTEVTVKVPLHLVEEAIPSGAGRFSASGINA